MLANIAHPLDAKTLPTLGEGIYDAPLAMRDIIDTLEDQRRHPLPGSDAAAATTAHPLTSQVHDQLREAHAIARLLRTVIDKPDADRALPGISHALFEMLGRLVEEVE